jgi:hypothetical protein
MSVGKIHQKFTDGNIPSIFPFVFISFLVVRRKGKKEEEEERRKDKGMRRELENQV